jgi:hypothetical protein
MRRKNRTAPTARSRRRWRPSCSHGRRASSRAGTA